MIAFLWQNGLMEHWEVFALSGVEVTMGGNKEGGGLLFMACVYKPLASEILFARIRT